MNSSKNATWHIYIPFFLSFLSINVFEAFEYKEESIVFTFKPKVDPRHLEDYLMLLREITGKEFYFEIITEYPLVRLKCLTDQLFFKRMEEAIKKADNKEENLP